MATDDPQAKEAANGIVDDAMFDMSMKKKKNKKLVDFDLDAPAEDSKAGAAPAEAAADGAAGGEENLDEMFGGLKKKSKKKKAIPMDLDDAPASGTATPTEEQPGGDGTATDAGAAAAEAVPDGDLDFGELKKKKKKSKKGGFDLEAFEKELGEETGAANGAGADDDVVDGAGAADYDEADLGDDPFGREQDGADGAVGLASEAEETWHGTDRDYTYQELMGRFFRNLRQQNPALSGDKKKYTIAPPVVQRDGSKKTMFANVIDICKKLHRQPEHVIQYLFTELGTVGSVDGSQRLIIKGRFQPVQIERVLRKYIVEYVTCKTCRSPNTLLTKENRIYFMRCMACGSTRSVTTIKSGFQAQTGKRSKMRAAAGA